MALSYTKLTPLAGLKFNAIKRSPDNNFRLQGYAVEIYVIQNNTAVNASDTLNTTLKKIHDIAVYPYASGAKPTILQKVITLVSQSVIWKSISIFSRFLV